MPKKGPSTIKDRLRRAVGQIKSVESMLESGDSTEKIIVQLKASISSLEAIKVALLKKKVKETIMRELDDVMRKF